MTGFGAADADVDGRRARIEIRTVNHRWFNLTTRLPADLAGVEGELRDALRRQFDRGHVNVQVHWVGERRGGVIDSGRAEQALASLRALQQQLVLPGAITLDLVLRQMEGLTAAPGERDAVSWQMIAPAVGEAAAACRAARAREGLALAAEIDSRLDALAGYAAAVGERAPLRLEAEQQRLRANVARLLQEPAMDQHRVAQEIALTADRLDITEELVRFAAHLAAARDALHRDTPLGKQLGFLAQEMGREVNTIGAKANDVIIAHAVVAMKGELEKVREQLENLE